jgi:hypothetical protein
MSDEGLQPDKLIAGVLETLRQSRALLLDPTPQNIDRCRAGVALCVRNFGVIVDADRSGSSSHLEPSLLLVRRELSAIAGLLDSAAVFHRNMMTVTSQASRPRVVEIDASPQKAGRVHVLG